MTNLQEHTAVAFAIYAAHLILKEGAMALYEAISGKLPRSGVQGVSSI